MSWTKAASDRRHANGCTYACVLGDKLLTPQVFAHQQEKKSDMIYIEVYMSSCMHPKNFVSIV